MKALQTIAVTLVLCLVIWNLGAVCDASGDPPPPDDDTGICLPPWDAPGQPPLGGVPTCTDIPALFEWLISIFS